MSQAAKSSDPDLHLSDFWHRLVRDAPARPASGGSQLSAMEEDIQILEELHAAPPRTLHSTPIVRSSPLSSPIRSMFETLEFGRQFDRKTFDVAQAEMLLPGLLAPEGDVPFFADDSSFDSLSASVDGLLQHRKRLVSSSINQAHQRKRVLVIGAGPAGLIAAVQLALRNHDVVVVEQREVYSRNRYIGVYKEVTHLLASLGMPESMTYDFSQYRGKRGIMLADIQTFLHGVALKLGIVIYTGAVAQNLDLDQVRSGIMKLQRAQRPESQSSDTVGLVRWRYDHITRVSSGVTITFDTILEASGGRSRLRETLVGPDNIVSIHEIGKAAAARDPSLASFFDDPEDHCAEYVESGYGCPPGLRSVFAAALLSGEEAIVPVDIPCFVSNIDASIFQLPMHQSEGSLGLASRIGDRDLQIPHDWVVLECRVSDQKLSRYHIEGPLPQHFEFGGNRYDTRSVLDRLNPVSFLLRILYAMGVPFDSIDRRQLVDFYRSESSFTDVSDIVCTWVGRFRGLRVGGVDPIWSGKVPASNSIEYGILGESLQNAWYRFGVGVDDSFTSALYFAAGLEFDEVARKENARKLERIMRSRAVQILYHLFAVAKNTDQGVIGAVLTEYYMDEQHDRNLAEATLREIAQEGRDLLAAANDLVNCCDDGLLETALDSLRKTCCKHALETLITLQYAPLPIQRTLRLFSIVDADWNANVFEHIVGMLSEEHREMLEPLFRTVDGGQDDADRNAQRRIERLREVASNRYEWTTPWVRACALRNLDPSDPSSRVILESAATDSDLLVAELANALLVPPTVNDTAVRTMVLDRVLLLKGVSIFADVPHDLLVDVAGCMTERHVVTTQRIIEKGDPGDAMYIIAEGCVEVMDGSRHIRYMTKGQIFGELSILDAEPRAASVVATEATKLFRLSQDDFYAVVQDHPEISRALNRTLCRLVRGT